jgi:hypothetical protein
MANRGGCIQPEIIPLEPDLDNTSEGNDTQNATHLQTGRFLLESAFFLGKAARHGIDALTNSQSKEV